MAGLRDVDSVAMFSNTLLQGYEWTVPSVWLGTLSGRIYVFPLDGHVDFDLPMAGKPCAHTKALFGSVSPLANSEHIGF